MNIALARSRPRSPAIALKTKFNPRSNIVTQVVAAELWMGLNLPSDLSRWEMEGFSRQLVERITSDVGEHDIEQFIGNFQTDRLFRPMNRSAIETLARRVVQIVTAV